MNITRGFSNITASWNLKIPSGSQARGFTVVELLIVVALASIALAASFPIISSSMGYYETEGALQLVVSQIRDTRQAAIDNRRAYRMIFTAPGSIDVWRQDASFSWVRDRQITVSEHVSFTLPAGVPRISIVQNSSDIDFGGENRLRFQADGSAVNTSGQTVSGIVYISRDGEAEGCRAVTVFGGTGLTRPWIYEGRQWK